ncbi:MAG: hypothetical protein M1826_005417 [Phylliscum demangeonii]|nr:MAG: hypothetical protein M1826_005417 [Phylliscum demangeonii]
MTTIPPPAIASPPPPPPTGSSPGSGSGSATAAASAASAFAFPAIHSFPPFYTLQPNEGTLAVQLASWSSIIQRYCRHQRLYQLSVTDAVATELFTPRALGGKRLAAADARQVLRFMWQREKSAEPVAVGGSGGGGGRAEAANVWWVWWRPVEEWARLVEEWVEATGQRNTVLTLYELTEGEGTRGTELHGLHPDVLLKALAVLARKGKAQVFGAEEQLGVKFF